MTGGTRVNLLSGLSSTTAETMGCQSRSEKEGKRHLVVLYDTIVVPHFIVVNNS